MQNGTSFAYVAPPGPDSVSQRSDENDSDGA